MLIRATRDAPLIADLLVDISGAQERGDIARIFNEDICNLLMTRSSLCESEGAYRLAAEIQEAQSGTLHAIDWRTEAEAMVFSGAHARSVREGYARDSGERVLDFPLGL
ncbi:MAG TPA: hypothetical protein PKV72_02440 [Candidatus Peribacteria bacterium]|nr:hypothetical protein [Candidatus Peribacteria bacterium]